jgi:hypothetical protein
MPATQLVSMQAALADTAAAPAANGIFVPQVSSLGEAPMPEAGDPMPSQQPVAQNVSPSIPVMPQGDQADLRQGVRDDAFVF